MSSIFYFFAVTTIVTAVSPDSNKRQSLVEPIQIPTVIPTLKPTLMPTLIPTIQSKPTLIPTKIPKPTRIPLPTRIVIIETKKATGVDNYNCDCSKTCSEMSSCVEAQYQLNVCGCNRRDADHDGIACDNDCQ